MEVRWDGSMDEQGYKTVAWECSMDGSAAQIAMLNGSVVQMAL